MKWTFPLLILDMCIIANEDVSQKKNNKKNKQKKKQNRQAKCVDPVETAHNDIWFGLQD